MNELQKRAYQFLKRKPDTEHTVSELARFLNLKLADKRDLRVGLKELVRDGKLVASHRNRRFAYSEKPPQSDRNSSLEKKAAQTLAEHMDAIIEEFQLPTRFPHPVLADAEQISDSISKESIRGRQDLRNQVTVTIDGETAKDFDDAISAEDIGRDRIRLRVSIADVSHYVAPGSAIDREAYARGTSVYFPNQVIPMLPEKLSNNVCSLVPEQDRLTMTAEIDFDPDGKVIRTKFYKSIIRSHARLTYTKVALALVEKDEDACHELRHLMPHLELMEKLYFRLRKRRMQRGSLDFDLPEPEIVMNMEEARVESIIKAERTQAHMMIEEFMIAANEAVARFITEHDAPMVYRIHEEPSIEKLKDLQVTLHNMGYSLKIPRKKIEPQLIADITKQAEGRAESRMVNTLILRSLAKAIYSIENKGHFGLASTCYTHFTSPIRRYPDLLVHRVLSKLIREHSQEPAPSQAIRRLDRIAEQCSIRERVAMQAEWAVRDLLQAAFMEDHVGESCTGIVSGVAKFGLFVELEPYFVEGLIHMRQLDDDYYRFVEESHMLIGKRSKKRYRIGDSLDVRVLKVDIEKRWIDLELVPKSEA